MIARALLLSGMLAGMGLPAFAASKNLWVCADQEGVTVEQDHPCDAGQQTISEPGRVGTVPLVEPEAPPLPSVEEPAIERYGGPKARTAPVVEVPPPSSKQLKLVGAGVGALLMLVVGAALVGRRQKIAQSPIPSARRVIAPPPPSRPSSWSLEVLRGLEARRFTQLCQRFWATKGYPARLAGAGDEGVDVIIADRANTSKVFAVARCVTGAADTVAVRALWEARDRLHASLAIFYGMSGFPDEAVAFAAGKHLKLVAGDELLRQIALQPEQVQVELLVAST